jgi:hypothetical protein
LEKKIIGYKLKDKKYLDAALNVINCLNPKEKYDFLIGSASHAQIEEADVLHWFSPIYEEFNSSMLNVGEIMKITNTNLTNLHLLRIKDSLVCLEYPDKVFDIDTKIEGKKLESNTIFSIITK